MPMFLVGWFCGLVFMIVGQSLGSWLEQQSCAQKHNVYSCDRTVSWVPITSLK